MIINGLDGKAINLHSGSLYSIQDKPSCTIIVSPWFIPFHSTSPIFTPFHPISLWHQDVVE